MSTLIRHPRSRFVLLAAILCATPQMCAAQRGEFGEIEGGGRRNPSKTTTSQDKGFLLRTYDVGDLVMNVHDHPYSDSLKAKTTRSAGGGVYGGGGGMMGMGGMGGMEGGDFGSTGRGVAPSNQETITLDDLLRVFTTTVSGATWSENGGPGEVQPLGSALVVWQSPTVHEQIQELLTQLRAGAGQRRTLTVDARWLLLDSDELDRLVLPDSDGLPRVERKELAVLTRRPSSLRGITTCFSGQTVYLVSGTRRNIVSSYIPVVGSLDGPHGVERLATNGTEMAMRFVADGPALGFGSDSRVGYQPVVSEHNFGALLEIRPTWLRGTETAMVDLKSTLTIPGESAGRMTGGALRAPTPPVVDRIAIETQELATTLRMPMRQPVLVGGMTYVPPSLGSSQTVVDPRLAAGQPEVQAARSENRQLYLVLELR